MTSPFAQLGIKIRVAGESIRLEALTIAGSTTNQKLSAKLKELVNLVDTLPDMLELESVELAKQRIEKRMGKQP